MAQECNNQEAREAYSTKGNSFKVPVTSVSIISKIINLLINLPNTPKPPIPRSLILIGSTFRPGINDALIKANVLQKLSQDGIPIGPLPSGGENLVVKAVDGVVDGVVDALLTKAKTYATNTKEVIVKLPDGTIGIIETGSIYTEGGLG